MSMMKPIWEQQKQQDENKALTMEQLEHIYTERFRKQKSSYNGITDLTAQFRWKYHLILKYTQFRFRGIKQAKDIKVLDIGPDHGIISKYFKEAGLHVTALDPSKEILAHVHREAGVDEIMQGRIEQIPFPPDSFDIIVADEILQTAFNPLACIQQCYRACKEGGVMYFTVPIGKELLDPMTRNYFDFYSLYKLVENSSSEFRIIRTNRGEAEGVKNTWLVIIYKNPEVKKNE